MRCPRCAATLSHLNSERAEDGLGDRENNVVFEQKI